MKAPTVRTKRRMRDTRQFAHRLCLILFLIAAFTALPCSEAAISPEEDAYAGPGWFIQMNRYAQSAHGTFACEKCHGDMKQGQTMHPDSEKPAFLKVNATREYDYRRCATCHKPSYVQYQKGAHADALIKRRSQSAEAFNQLPQMKRAPTCGNCHSSHYAKAHLSRVEIGRHMVSTCGACHPAQAATYLNNYHGKAAVNLGNKKAAFCTDCHGAHHCRSLKDPKTALAACRRCHPEAKASFAQVVIHPTTKDLAKDNKDKRARVALIRVVTILMGILVILVVGFFYGHSFVWMLRELHERLRKHKP